MDDDDPGAADRQEWTDWAEHGYAKRWTPRSVLRVEGLAIVLVAALVLALVLIGFR